MFTDAQKKQVARAVEEAERHTTGEIVPVVIGQSDDYPGARWRVAVAVGLLVAFCLYFFLPDLDPIWFLAAQFPGLYIGYLLSAWRPLKRLFLDQAKADEEVHQRALEAFYYQDLHGTKDRTGVLIFISLFEHRVEILADSGINQKVTKDTWNNVVGDLIVEIKKGVLIDGVTHAVERCGKILAQHFPGSHENVNEISNKIILLD